MVEHTSFIEFYAAVQRRLSAKRKQDAIGPFFFDDTLHKLGRDGLEIDGVGHILAGLHGGDVRIDQHRVDALFLQGFQRLRAAIVELARLSNL